MKSKELKVMGKNHDFIMTFGALHPEIDVDRLNQPRGKGLKRLTECVRQG